MDTDSIINTEEGKLLPRLEKKARQSLAKLGLKKVEGITRVVFRRPQGVLLVVAKPEVYRSAHSDCYIVFGDAKMEDPNSFSAQALAAAQAAEARQQAEEARKAKAAGRVAGQDETTVTSSGGNIDPNDVFAGVEEKTSDNADEGDVDETGVDANDIKTVMTSTSATREKAVKALKDSKGDIINAIMALS